MCCYIKDAAAQLKDSPLAGCKQFFGFEKYNTILFIAMA
jgi:hypothetical protein